MSLTSEESCEKPAAATYLAERRVVAMRLLRDFPDRVPTALWLPREAAPEGGENDGAEGRFLVARSLTVGHFALFLRELLDLGPTSVAPLFLWTAGRALHPLISFRTLQEKYQETDGFVHLLMSDMGGPLVEDPLPATAAEAASVALATSDTVRPSVACWPPELVHSFQRLRYPSPPEPGKNCKASRVAFPNERRLMPDLDDASMASVPTGQAFTTKHSLPPLQANVVARPPSPPRTRKVRQGQPRPQPPTGLAPRAPPLPADADTWPALGNELAMARGAGPAVSDDEEGAVSSALHEEMQLALGVQSPGRAVAGVSVTSTASTVTPTASISARQLFQQLSPSASTTSDLSVLRFRHPDEEHEDKSTPHVMEPYVPQQDPYIPVEMTTAVRLPSWLRGPPKAEARPLPL